MAKKQTKKQKVNVVGIVTLVLLGLVLGGVILNTINDTIKEDDPIVDVIPGEDEEQPGEEVELLTLVIDGSNYGCPDLIIKYEEGMTCGEWVESEYNTTGASLMEYDETSYGIYLGSDYGTLTDDSTSSPDVFSHHLIDGLKTYNMC